MNVTSLVPCCLLRPSYASFYIDFKNECHPTTPTASSTLPLLLAHPNSRSTAAPQTPPVRRAVEKAGLPHPGCCMSPPAAAPFELNRQCFCLCHRVFSTQIYRAAKRSNRWPGQRFVAITPLPCTVTNSIAHCHDLRGCPSLHLPRAGAVVPLLELYFPCPSLYLHRGQRHTTQRQPTYVDKRGSHSLIRLSPQQGLCLPMQYLASSSLFVYAAMM
ncbi:hypothetical protein HDV63DRAFT_79503 [Trichoderma sp. SZMC 28014]